MKIYYNFTSVVITAFWSDMVEKLHTIFNVVCSHYFDCDRIKVSYLNFASRPCCCDFIMSDTRILNLARIIQVRTYAIFPIPNYKTNIITRVWLMVILCNFIYCKQYYSDTADFAIPISNTSPHMIDTISRMHSKQFSLKYRLILKRIVHD